MKRHLIESMRALRVMKRPERNMSPVRPEPEGFVGTVTRTACTLCRGWCCKSGEEHAFLDERVMARVRRARPELEARNVLRLYIERIPAEAYQDSCVFQGASGCTLDRDLRSDVCNSFFCTPLVRFMKHADAAESAHVTAGDGDAQRGSILFRPGCSDSRR